MKQLAIVTTHPIQYYAPVFQLLAKKAIGLKVFYTWGEDSVRKYDPDFKRLIEWDIPLLDGYDYAFLKNISTNPGTSHFKGIVNPTAISEIDAFNPDAVLVYGWSWQSHLKIIRYYGGKKKLWFRGDSTLLDRQHKFKEIVRGFLLRWIYKKVDAAFYVGRRNKEYFKKFGLREAQLHFAPHAIDNCRFSQDRVADAEAIRSRLNIPAAAILVLFAGKFEPKKDPMILLHSFIELPNQDDVYLLFVGNGNLEGELKRTAASSAKNEKVLFLDFQNQQTMPAIYQACQLYCLPSAGPGETWGLAVNEAMASGKAVLVSDKTGCAVDLVQEGVNGATFIAGHKTDLTEKLHTITRDREQLLQMGEASARIIENWSFEHQMTAILEQIAKI